MSNLLLFFKDIVEKIPYPIGKYLTNVPYRIRLGEVYSLTSRNIRDFQSKKSEYVIENFSRAFNMVKVKYPFYNNLYRSAGVYNINITSLNDIEKIPIITKSDIRKWINQFSGAYKLNTGGSTGEPFSFYVDKDAFAREWAHMHYIWGLRDYNPRDIKITLRGRNLGQKYYFYNPIHNEFVINTYKSASEHKSEIMQLFQRFDIKYFHGYPSAVYNFLRELEIVLNPEEKSFLKGKVRACLLGSEFPAPNITNYISSVWGFDYISWYGHSEMCILAFDQYKINHYTPFPTYGYTEVVNKKLIGTSYHNMDMPLIRYDTGDLVDAEYQDNGLIDFFSVTSGREGEFIIDKMGKKIPLTALIYGRHHKIFEYARHIQVSQSVDGMVTFYICMSNNLIQPVPELFDLNDVNIEYNFKIITDPIKSVSGKVNLLIK